MPKISFSRRFQQELSACATLLHCYSPLAFSPPSRWIFALTKQQPIVKIFCGSSNPPLAQAICPYIGIELGQSTIKPFPDREPFVKIEQHVRGEDVYLIHSPWPPLN